MQNVFTCFFGDSSILAKSLQIITGLLGTAIRSLALAAAILETLWGLLLAALCFWIAADGSTTRGVIALILALLLVTACTLVIAVYYSALSVVRKAVSDAALGRNIFDALFEYALGISGNDNGEPILQSRIPAYMSREQVEAKLSDASKFVLSDKTPSSKWVGPFFWLAKKIQKIAVWATVKVILMSCSYDGQSVNMFELRDRLASTIDDCVVDYLQQHFIRLAILAITVASLISIILAFAIGQLPL